jgi:hypothetical protein
MFAGKAPLIHRLFTPKARLVEHVSIDRVRQRLLRGFGLLGAGLVTTLGGMIGIFPILTSLGAPESESIHHETT